MNINTPLIYATQIISAAIIAYLLLHNMRLQGLAAEKHQREKQLRQQAQYDALTGLPNRLVLEEQLQQQVLQCQQTQRGMAVLFIDLDDFKPINDSLGHRIGDRVLMEVATRLAACLPDQATLVRFGGDEFVALLPNLQTSREVLPLIRQLLQSVARNYLIEGNALQLSASIGGAFYDGQQDISANLLIQQADMAMYKAKRGGHNHFYWYDSQMESKLRRRVEMRNALQQAMDNQQLQLHYQPLVDAVSGQTVSVEALLRWRHPDKGMISPAEFVPLAEQTGQIIQLTEWTLQQACRDLHRLKTLGIRQVAVNISAIQLLRSGFVEQLVELVKAHQVLPAELEIELTESVLLEDATLAQEVINQLRRLGFKVTMDDFGTGFSSLSYLKNLQVGKIKMDQCFIHDITHNSQSAAIVKTIITLATQLGIQVVAEGVEQQEQAELLENLGCHHLQGYYYSKALHLDLLPAYLQSEQQFTH